MTLTLSDQALVSTTQPGYDLDAANYFARVELADGETLETSVKAAIDAFFIGLKADGDFSKLKAACILGGARTLAGSLVPLVATMPSPINAGFVAGDRSRSLGLLGNGANKYLDVNRQSNSEPQNDYHQLAYVTSMGSANLPVICYGFGGTSEATHLIVNDPPTSMVFRNRQFGTAGSIEASTTGFFGTSRNNSGTYEICGPQDSATITKSANSLVSRKTFVLGRSTSDSSDENPTVFGNARVLFYSVGESLTLTNVRSRLNTLAAALATL